MKKWIPTVVVLATLACLGAWVLLFESKPKTGEEGRDTLWKLKQEKIVKFELRQLDRGTAVVCEKDKAGAWWITYTCAGMEGDWKKPSRLPTRIFSMQ